MPWGPQVDGCSGDKPKGYSSVILPAQVHDETVAVGYRVGSPVKALACNGVDYSVASA